MGSFNYTGIVILLKSFPIASFKIYQIPNLYPSGMLPGKESLALRLW